MDKRGIIIIGEGPAGLMAAGTAAETGADVLLLGKTDKVGKKLLITGNGRCNLTNTTGLREFIDRFGKGGKFLRQALTRFFNTDLMAFFESLGVPLVIESGQFVFTKSGKSRDVVDAITKWALNNGMTIRLDSAVKEILVEDKHVKGVRLDSGEQIGANAVILATGGASYPATGSQGDGFAMAKKTGHHIVPIRPTLVPLKTAGKTAQSLQGLSLADVNVRILIDGKRLCQKIGEILFTHFGLSGPTVLSLSKSAVDSLAEGKKVTASIDFKPELDEKKLDELLMQNLAKQGKAQIGTMLKKFLPSRLATAFCELTNVEPAKPCSQVSANERKKLRLLMKDFRLEIVGHLSFEQAIVTAGGVDTKQIDPRTMESKIIDGLYFAGEVIDIDADTGGFNLQAAFSTGSLAGHSAAEKIKHP